MEPITRDEMYLAKAGGQEVALPEPITREELFLAKLAGQAVETPEPITRKEMFLAAAIENGGGTGGSAEVKTCNVRFVGQDDAYAQLCHYTKCVDGIVSVETIGDGSSEQNNFDIVLENVVCGSFIYFYWGYSASFGITGYEAVIEPYGSAEQIMGLYGDVAESSMFKAPEEDGCTCTITICGY